jgi:hypothetical protein
LCNRTDQIFTEIRDIFGILGEAGIAELTRGGSDGAQAALRDIWARLKRLDVALRKALAQASSLNSAGPNRARDHILDEWQEPARRIAVMAEKLQATIDRVDAERALFMSLGAYVIPHSLSDFSNDIARSTTIGCERDRDGEDEDDDDDDDDGHWDDAVEFEGGLVDAQSDVAIRNPAVASQSDHTPKNESDGSTALSERTASMGNHGIAIANSLTGLDSVVPTSDQPMRVRRQRQREADPKSARRHLASRLFKGKQPLRKRKPFRTQP